MVEEKAQAPLNASRRVLVMGVSGGGKSTIGEAMGECMNLPYIDGDRYHPQVNIDKMSRGEPLNDDDRAGWLERLSEVLAKNRANDRTVIIGCSALKRAYRDVLRRGDPDLIIVYLEGSYDLILQRMRERQHFFSADMLMTQFETLEPPGDDEAMRVDISQAFDEVVRASVGAVHERDRQLSQRT